MTDNMGLISMLNQNVGATNAILTATLVLVNIFLAGATWIYARKTSESLDILRKDKERPKILDEVQFVLTPVINLLEMAIKAIELNDIFWNISLAVPRFNKLDEIKIGTKEQNHALRDVFRKNPQLEEKFNLHNELYKKSLGLYENLEKLIDTEELKTYIRESIKKFNEPRHPSYKISLDTYKIFMNAIINKSLLPKVINTGSPPHLDQLSDFWKQYERELMKFRDKPEIKKVDDEIYTIFNEIIKIDKEIYENLRSIREEYRSKYDLTQEEIDTEKMPKALTYL